LVVGGTLIVSDWQLTAQGVSSNWSTRRPNADERVWRHSRLPPATTDHAAVVGAQLRMSAAFIDESIKAGKTVLVRAMPAWALVR